MKLKPKEIFEQLLEKDAFSKWLGIELLEIDAGYAKISMLIRDDMLNGFELCHGGVTFAFADTALGIASNARGTKSIGIENNINYTKKVLAGDILIAETEEVQNGRTIGVYKVKITNQKNELVAEFRGTVFRNKI